ncbi:flavodoxin family protein [Ideonella sp.]|uniref:flavodoxin family protein n=1 Tax=Ideonella sp. TaxID=1929293 RepID=UPI0035B4911F
MSRILVVYFSRTGYTRRVAESLAQRLGAQLAPIDEPRSRRGILGYIRSAREAMRRAEVEITAPAADPGEFDLVLIGTPVWASHASPPARTLALRWQGRVKRVALFCTLGGSGAEAALAELQLAIGQAPVATLALTDRKIDAGTAATKLDAFVAALGAVAMPPVALKRAA